MQSLYHSRTIRTTCRRIMCPGMFASLGLSTYLQNCSALMCDGNDTADGLAKKGAQSRFIENQSKNLTVV